ncbi:CCG-BINDING PROTEIN 1, maternal effect embryo arrest 14 [Hibiscus trionum]|uniref:CCG-BINDING PROTEIN 1, maternal effect embryo arrest 14 n=1 Tax=Hibiscus trionum TaxID=183268 RepID=A0A9W7HK10_HIBTR|nr:CCG-BINDING PROTEIN 1, maternal effect embryo arrest 14 [Hibiscus trionum]
MIKSIPLRPYSSPILVDVKDIHRTGLSPPSKTRFASTIRSSSSSDAYIPKLEPFSRTKFERVVKEPPLIEKSENQLADYCSTLEGDDSYSCWRAYFELKDLEKETPKEDVEKIIIQAGGVKSLIGLLHGIASIHKENIKGFSRMAKPLLTENEGTRFFHIPDGLPKSAEELEEEERARMPDSPFTRMLRTKGTFPAWYSPAPDHETD